MYIRIIVQSESADYVIRRRQSLGSSNGAEGISTHDVHCCRGASESSPDEKCDVIILGTFFCYEYVMPLTVLVSFSVLYPVPNVY